MNLKLVQASVLLPSTATGRNPDVYLQAASGDAVNYAMRGACLLYTSLNEGSESSMFDLTGKVALVTGAAHGLGKGIAICLAKAGAHVVINDICEPKEAEDALSQVETAEKPAVFMQADVSEEAEDVYKRQV